MTTTNVVKVLASMVVVCIKVGPFTKLGYEKIHASYLKNKEKVLMVAD
ncbi:MAG: hypothetical protein ACERKD_20170 [Prolixibacteraceae bacterium]